MSHVDYCLVSRVHSAPNHDHFWFGNTPFVCPPPLANGSHAHLSFLIRMYLFSRSLLIRVFLLSFLIRMSPLSLLVRMTSSLISGSHVHLAHFWLACPPLLLLVRMLPFLANGSHVPLSTISCSNAPSLTYDSHPPRSLLVRMPPSLTSGSHAPFSH